MAESPSRLSELRRMAQAVRLPAAAEAADWATAGLARGALHELFAGEPEDDAAATGFAVALAVAAGALPLLWLRTEASARAGGGLHAGGLVELGLPPEAVLMALVPDETALLRAAADAARCPGLGTLLVESRGRAPGLDLTATRRLMLAAEAGAVLVLVLRVGAEPAPSAAATRWRVAAAPSIALEADAPGAPAFQIELLRQRGGPAGQRWRVEWNRDTTSFDAAPLPGAGLPLAADRAAARHSPAPLRRAG